MRKHAKRFLVLLAATVTTLAAGAVAVSAQSTTVTAGNLVLKLESGITPKALSKTKLSPIAFQLGVDVDTRDGTHPPAAHIFNGEIDRNGAVNTKGLPVCREDDLKARTTAGAEQACKTALVGRGTAMAEVEFPEQPAFDAKGPLLVFNGGTKGKKTLILVHVFASVPAPTAFVTPVYVTKIDGGRYGLKFESKIPVIAGGSGSLSELHVSVAKTFKYKGRKQSYLLARCPSGSLFGRGDLSFSDGTKLTGTLSESCTPAS